MGLGHGGPVSDILISTLTMIQTIAMLATLGLACSLPTETTLSVDERVVNREEAGESDRTISDDMIRQISDCKSGEDRGHPDLQSGCLLKIDFTMLRSECQNSKLSFPTDTENIWHPRPTCNGEYCQ